LVFAHVRPWHKIVPSSKGEHAEHSKQYSYVPEVSLLSLYNKSPTLKLTKKLGFKDGTFPHHARFCSFRLLQLPMPLQASLLLTAPTPQQCIMLLPTQMLDDENICQDCMANLTHHQSSS